MHFRGFLFGVHQSPKVIITNSQALVAEKSSPASQTTRSPHQPVYGAAPTPKTPSRAEPQSPHALVSPWGALPGVFGLPPQPQRLGPAESGRRADLLLLVAVHPLQDGLLGLQRLCLRLCLRRHSCEESSVSTRICGVGMCSPAGHGLP